MRLAYISRGRLRLRSATATRIGAGHLSIRLHTSAYVSIRQHTLPEKTRICAGHLGTCQRLVTSQTAGLAGEESEYYYTCVLILLYMRHASAARI